MASASLAPPALTVRGLLALAVALTVASGCATSGPATTRTPGPAAAGPGSASAVELRLREAVAGWRGTPYRIGGQSRSGVDCSGLVQAVYASAFALSLPRTTEQQVREGRRVRRDNLQTGDLVFFRPSRKTRHVGIYLSGGSFAHASTSQGVTISQLDERYWRDRYWTARRVLRTTLPPAAPDPVRATPARTTPSGW